MTARPFVWALVCAALACGGAPSTTPAHDERSEMSPSLPWPYPMYFGKFAPAITIPAAPIPNTIATGAAGWWDASDFGVSGASWPDKTGNGRTWTQSTGGLQPTVVTGQQGGRTCVRFNGSQVMTQSSFVVSPPFTIWAVGKQTGGGVGLQFMVTLSGANLTFRDAAGFMSFDENAIVTSSTVPTFPTSVAVSVAGFGTSISFRSFGSPVLAVSPGGGSAYAPGAFLGSDAANPVGANSLTGDLYEWAIWPRVLSAFENMQNDLYGSTKYQLVGAGSNLLIVDGNSFVNGTGSSGGAAYFLGQQILNLLQPSYGATYILNNNGLETTPLMTNFALTQTDPYSTRGFRGKVVAVGVEGTNDIVFNGADARTAFAHTVAYCQGRRAAGLRVVVPSILSRSDASAPPNFNAIRAGYNNLLRTNWPTFADGFADWASDPTMGPNGAESNLAYFANDLVHPNNNGYEILAGYVAAAVLGLP